jgi:ABC-type transporter Mla MlaB component
MLKITKTAEQDGGLTVKLEGKLLEAWVGEVFDACAEAEGRADPCRLDLSGVTFADAAGAAVLRILIRRGLFVVACSGFLAELLGMEK